ncbi:DEAD-domain-containing protein [Basidiobolus meristosporus CBS 931.73]|uniref:RNA helicase n=1 Tax=Basidiobolus meristosporus CBS 931.73 TaxID=1314790 RepID=A0A1Y1XHS0_9FUNG|nr:DEAD-domain-containing protein [Basidiobolus meristosporus CBS 931.73]|eukprot:ORX85300.1 DEAD-domain-containing protein [Basidiobolus meristosporus CBS 931.73]
MQAIPCIMSGRDVIGLAETGSGKTLAFILPMLTYLQHVPTAQPGEGPRVLIVVPTRELADQIYEEIQYFNESSYYDFTQQSSYSNNHYPSTTIQPGVVYNTNGGNPPGHTYANSFEYQQNSAYQGYRNFNHSGHQQVFKVLGATGGFSIMSQILPLRQHGVDILVGTPGRLIDLISRGELQLDRLSYLVMDEVDRMLSLNLEEQLRWIFTQADQTLRPRQTLLWSATLPHNLERLARSGVLNPITIEIGAREAAPMVIEQKVHFCHYFQKKVRAERYAQSLVPMAKISLLIFCNSSYAVDKLVQLLRSEQFHAAGIHGEKDQSYRFRVMKAMKESQLDILVATDVASRGIDIPDVTHVINWELPDDIDTYTHRIGRTGRAGKLGKASSLLTLDCKIAHDLKKSLEKSKQAYPHELEDTRDFGKKIIRTELGDRVARY